MFFVAILLAMPTGCTWQVDASDYIAQCEPGFIRCDGSDVLQCASDGKSFDLLEACEEGSTCLDGTCTPLGDGVSEESGGESGGEGSIATPPTNWTPPAGDPKLGQVFGIVAHLSIQTAFPGAFVDVGICAGSAVVTIPDHPTACADSLFVRITRSHHGLEGMFWHHGPEDDAPVPLESEPILLDPDDVFVLGFTDYATEGVAPGFIRISMSLKSLAGITPTAFATAEVPVEHVQAFGAWNWETEGDPDASLSGTLAALEVEIVGAPALTIADLLELGIHTGDFVTSDSDAPSAEFYSAQDEAGAIQLPIQEAMAGQGENPP